MVAPAAVFVFPSAAGHVNPSLPLCRGLVNRGWQVDYLSVVTFQSAIESTGATFHNRDAVCAEFGFHDLTAMTMKTFDEYGTPGAKMWALNFGSIMADKLLPVYIQFLTKCSPRVVVYCPVLCQVARFAALKLGIPHVSVLTAAGPGYWDAAFASPAASGVTAAGLIAAIQRADANTRAVESIRAQIGEPGDGLTLNTDAEKPVVCDYYTDMNLVTTTASLADKLNDKDAAYYEAVGKTFEFLGPLFLPSSEGSEHQATAAAMCAESVAVLFRNVDEAMAGGQRIVYVSLGTVLTSASDQLHGWEGRSGSAITGRELCQGVYRAVFALLGVGSTTPLISPPPLIIVSTGPQADALDGLAVPANAVCLQSVPQVLLLQRARPSLAAVVIHGGQNSFTEALSVGAPLVVCPGFGDQVANANRAQVLGVGVKVDRPDQCGDKYEASVAEAIRSVVDTHHEAFVTRAQVVARELQQAPGLARAVELVSAAANCAIIDSF